MARKPGAGNKAIGLKGFYEVDAATPVRLVEVLKYMLTPKESKPSGMSKEEIEAEIQALENNLKKRKEGEYMYRAVKNEIGRLSGQLKKMKGKGTTPVKKEDEVKWGKGVKEALEELRKAAEKTRELLEKVAELDPEMKKANPPKIKIAKPKKK